MPKASVLQFNNYKVEEIIFKSTPVSNGKHQFELHPRFQQKVVDCGENRHNVYLSVEIASSEDNPMPFQLRVSIVGQFVFCDEEGTVDQATKDRILQKNTVSILFPFLRSIVASLTSNANIPTLVLPIMNFADDK